MSTVKAEEAARLAEESSDDGVLPACSTDTGAEEALELASVAFVGAIAASNVDASSDIDVSLAGWGCIGASLGDSFGGAGAGAGEQDWPGTASWTGVIGCSLT